MNFAPYPKYKASGVEWLGDVPEHWKVVRVASLGRLRKGTGGSKQDELQDGVPCIRYGDLYSTYGTFISGTRSYISTSDTMMYTAVSYGDVLFAASGETFEDIGRSAVVMIEGGVFCGGDLIILQCTSQLDVKFSGYALDAVYVRKQKSVLGRGTTVKHIYPSQIKNLLISLPPPPEQRVIAAFLDRETAKIDALVEEQRKLIELLKEKRQALITHAVTKGLNPKAKMKDSGIEWLGQVPEHWDFRKLSHLGNIVGGGTPSRDNPDYWNGDIPWVSSKDVKVAHISDSEEHITSRGLAESTTRLVQPGTILMVVRSGILQHTLPVAITRSTVAINQDIKAIAFFEDTIVASYFRYFVVGYNNQLLYDWSTQGATVESIDMNLLRKTLIPVPPVDEQEEIALHLQHDGQRFDGLIHEASTAIELLTERRSALISAAVTGKIDVRDMIDEEATT